MPDGAGRTSMREGAHLQVREVREQKPLGTRVSSCTGRELGWPPWCWVSLGFSVWTHIGGTRRSSSPCALVAPGSGGEHAQH